MAKRKNERSNLKKMATLPSSRQSVDVTNVEAALLGLSTEPNRGQPESAYLALKYYQSEHECFSEWSADELRAFSEFSRKLSQQTWQDIFRSGGSIGKKTGLGYTQHKNKSKLPKCDVIGKISDEIDFFELRVTRKARAHGFRSKSTFFLVWLDRNHLIYKV